MSIITTSIFDIFKIGPGPSSSHTIGPMKAANLFRTKLAEAHIEPTTDLSLKVHLYGSLSLTGKGHGTHKAIITGLLGETPETCDISAHLLREPSQKETFSLIVAALSIPFSFDDIKFEGFAQDLPYANTLKFELYHHTSLILSQEYYSVGGGFIESPSDTPSQIQNLPYSYGSMRELRLLLKHHHISLEALLRENEKVISGLNDYEIDQRLDDIVSVMRSAVDNGLSTDGLLPGPIGLLRKAQVLFHNSKSLNNEVNASLGHLNAYALAVSEENAAGKRVVTAPTSGSAGLLPAIIYYATDQFSLTPKQIRSGLMAAAMIAFIAKHNASIAGAEVGCQGEIGVASSMGAAFLAAAMGKSIREIENSAEIALEHHLGMTCDPIEGYVQIPCIERNAVGAVTALNAYLLATVGEPLRQKVGFDEIVETMKETGQDMSNKYKETSLGGMAVCVVSC